MAGNSCLKHEIYGDRRVSNDCARKNRRNIRGYPHFIFSEHWHSTIGTRRLGHGSGSSIQDVRAGLQVDKNVKRKDSNLPSQEFSGKTAFRTSSTSLRHVRKKREQMANFLITIRLFAAQKFLENLRLNAAE